jgi:predicted HicB family RNase H-like nuclease
MLEYKGYIGHVEFDDENDIFHGEVLNTKDVITFQGKSTASIKKAFRDSIDDYLAFCKKRKEQPDKPYSGKFNVRLGEELHRKADLAANKAHMSLNGWVKEVVNRAANR